MILELEDEALAQAIYEGEHDAKSYPWAAQTKKYKERYFGYARTVKFLAAAKAEALDPSERCPTCGQNYPSTIRVGDEDRLCHDGWHQSKGERPKRLFSTMCDRGAE